MKARKRVKKAYPVKLWRAGKWPVITRARLRDDGVHFISTDNKEDSWPGYSTLGRCNAVMRKCGYGEFQIVKRWPITEITPTPKGRR